VTYVRDLVGWLDANLRCNNPYGMDLVFAHASFDALTSFLSTVK
jgi:hypothetical protein